MRGNSQAVSARLRATTPARRGSAWLIRAQAKRRWAMLEQLETIARLEAEKRRALRAGEYQPKLRPWL
ncbi:MAG TPA: hypothetical protein VFH80_26275 [Solirubrobacteraceae bacterium]|nr:hypothetical protein [Solirubrobacteraceae bacterium]